jgi:hypothetical protein
VYIDIGGLASNRQLLGLDDASVDAALQQDPSLKNVVKLAAKQTLYDVWDGLTAGFVSKHDALFEANEQGAISDSDYWAKTTGEASKSLLVTTVSAVTGGGGGGVAAKTLGGAVVQGAVRGAVGGATSNVTADLTEQVADVALGNRPDIDIRRTVEAAKTGAVTGAFFGAIAGRTEHLRALAEEENFVVVPGQKHRLGSHNEAELYKEARLRKKEYIAVTEDPTQGSKVDWGDSTGVDIPDDLRRATKVDHPHHITEVAGFSVTDVNSLMTSNAPPQAILTVQGRYGPTRDAFAKAGVEVNIPGASAEDVVTLFITKGEMVEQFNKAKGRLRQVSWR